MLNKGLYFLTVGAVCATDVCNSLNDQERSSDNRQTMIRVVYRKCSLPLEIYGVIGFAIMFFWHCTILE